MSHQQAGRTQTGGHVSDEGPQLVTPLSHSEQVPQGSRRHTTGQGRIQHLFGTCEVDFRCVVDVLFKSHWKVREENDR